MNISFLVSALAAVVLVTAVIRLIQIPLRIAAKVLLNTVIGYAALWLVDLAAPVTGLYLGLNAVNALIVGVFGVPGLILLVLVQWVL